MGKLIYLLNVSLDGFIETPDHGLDWALVDEELHSWFNDETRSIDATLYGRRLYEVVADHWPTAGDDPSATDAEREFARIWNRNIDWSFTPSSWVRALRSGPSSTHRFVFA